MFELLFVWIISALALGFGGIVIFLFVQSALSGLSRVVFIDPEEAQGHINMNGQSPA